MSYNIGRGMLTSWRGHRSHITGKDGGKDWWSPTFCYVSCPQMVKGIRAAHHIAINIIAYAEFPLPADINLQTKRRGKHWKEETSVSCTTPGRLRTVLSVRDEIHLYVK